MVKKLFILFTFLNFCGSVSFGTDSYVSDKCYKSGYSFRDPLVQQYINDYEVLINDYIMALKEKDHEKLQILTTTSQEFPQKVFEIGERIDNPEEAKKLNDEITEIVTCFADKTSYIFTEND